MGGGLMQLVAYGAQDIYLTGNPQITFFKVVYRRHTNFSMESILQTFNGSLGTGASTLTSTISRNGDLVSNLMLESKIKGHLLTDDKVNTYWTNNTGHALIKEAEIEIGGQRIDRHYSQWLDIENEVNGSNGGVSAGGVNSQDAPGLNKSTANTMAEDLIVPDAIYTFYIPLKFWFCRNHGLALPLIALQYHEVKLKILTRALSGLVNTLTGSPNSPVSQELNLYADYIYLDTDERRRFAQVSHEYLIEQVQRESGAMAETFKLNFNHPVKELLWVVQDNAVIVETLDQTHGDARINNQGAGSGVSGVDYFNYKVMGKNNVASLVDHTVNASILGVTGAGGNEMINNSPQLHGFGTAKLKLNGHDRFSARPPSYFHRVQMTQSGHAKTPSHIYCYSFALKPVEHQPSGTCNFSRIDNAEFIFEAKSHTGLGVVEIGGTSNTSGSTVTVYAVNYNVLRIMSGMGGLAYSN
jgi:hypothetical protein